MRSFHPRVSIALALAVAAGCGPGEYTKVRGKLTVGGVPLANASVQFVPVWGGQPAQATTESDGSFSVSTANGGQGVAAGEYAVLVTWEEPPHPYLMYREGAPKRAELEEDYKKWKATHRKKASPVPPEYAEPARTPLKATVPLPGGEFNIDIPAKGN